MTRLLKHAQRGFTLLIVALIASAVLTPVSALADTNLVVGGTAKIAYANGDDVRLRQSPSKSGAIINTISEGSTVDVVDGPVYADDGSAWYKVSFDGDTGYVIADYLALANGGSSDAPSGPASNVVGQALIAGTSGDGVRCRASADPNSSVITVVPEGTIVSLTGSPVGNYQPISCGGQTGYVHVDYVSYDMTGTDNKGDAGRAADAAAASSSSSNSTSGASANSSSVTGTATVAGTNGDGVRCRAAASSNGQIGGELTLGGDVALLDADALLNPLVGRIDRLGEFRIADDVRRQIAADTTDNGTGSGHADLASVSGAALGAAVWMGKCCMLSPILSIRRLRAIS